MNAIEILKEKKNEFAKARLYYIFMEDKEMAILEGIKVRACLICIGILERAKNED